MEQETIEVPDNALVRCPKASFDLVRASSCASCDKFAGLLDRFPNSDYNFDKRYLIQCNGEPAKREMFRLEEVSK